jgi:hypothetical protein
MRSAIIVAWLTLQPSFKGNMHLEVHMEADIGHVIKETANEEHSEKNPERSETVTKKRGKAYGAVGPQRKC